MKLKNIVCFVVSFLVLLGTSFATETIAPKKIIFSDVDGHWASDAIYQMVDKGVLSGYGNGTFKPNGNVTREEFAVILTKTLDLTDTSTAIDFKDVNDSRWSNQYIDVAGQYFSKYKKNGEYYFYPNSFAERLDMAVAIVKAEGLQLLEGDAVEEELARFKDASSIAENFRPYVATASRTGIINGYTDGTFRPKGNLTRAEVAALMNKLSGGNDEPVTKTSLIKLKVGSYNSDAGVSVNFTNTTQDYIAGIMTETKGKTLTGIPLDNVSDVDYKVELIEFPLEKKENYTIKITKEKHNSFTIKNVIVEGNVVDLTEIFRTIRLTLIGEGKDVVVDLGKDILYGDIDGDLKVTEDDAILLLQYSMMPDIYGDQVVDNVNVCGDVNLDGNLDVDDAILVKVYVDGGIDKLPYTRLFVCFNESETHSTYQLFDFAEAKALAPNTFNKANHSFVGWAKTTDGGAIYKDKAPYTAYENLSLYPVWEKDSISYGDVNNDGIVDGNDVTLIFAYLDGSSVDINKENADVNLDSKVDDLDKTIIFRHVTGVTGYETLPYLKEITKIEESYDIDMVMERPQIIGNNDYYTLKLGDDYYHEEYKVYVKNGSMPNLVPGNVILFKAKNNVIEYYGNEKMGTRAIEEVMNGNPPKEYMLHHYFSKNIPLVGNYKLNDFDSSLSSAGEDRYPSIVINGTTYQITSDTNIFNLATNERFAACGWEEIFGNRSIYLNNGDRCAFNEKDILITSLWNASHPEDNRHYISYCIINVPIESVPHTINISSVYYGCPSNEDVETVRHGEDITIYFDDMEKGYQIKNVTIDGISKGAISSYTFNNVTTNHSVSVTYEMVPSKPTVPEIKETKKTTSSFTITAKSSDKDSNSLTYYLFVNDTLKATKTANPGKEVTLEATKLNEYTDYKYYVKVVDYEKNTVTSSTANIKTYCSGTSYSGCQDKFITNNQVNNYCYACGGNGFEYCSSISFDSTGYRLDCTKCSGTDKNMHEYVGSCRRCNITFTKYTCRYCRNTIELWGNALREHPENIAQHRPCQRCLNQSNTNGSYVPSNPTNWGGQPVNNSTQMYSPSQSNKDSSSQLVNPSDSNTGSLNGYSTISNGLDSSYRTDYSTTNTSDTGLYKGYSDTTSGLSSNYGTTDSSWNYDTNSSIGSDYGYKGTIAPSTGTYYDTTSKDSYYTPGYTTNNPTTYYCPIHKATLTNPLQKHCAHGYTSQH